MTNFEKLKNMTTEEFAAEFMIFRPSDCCFEDENKNYVALDGSWHKHSQDCFRANLKWLNEEIVDDSITDEQWKEAENNLNFYISEYAAIGSSGMFGLYGVLVPLKNRFDKGERTKELYDEMMGLE